MPVLVEAKIKKLTFPGYEQSVLQDIDLTIEQGEFVVISGPVAAGKTTLCHCLTGAVPHFFPASLEGQVCVDGVQLAHIPLPQVAGTVGYMMQDPQNQLFSTTVGEDVAFGPCNLGLPRPTVVEQVKAAMEFTGLQGFDERSTDSLSGGEAQRAVLAGVLAMNPRLLVLDQPTAELDPAGRQDIWTRLGTLNRTEKTTIIVVADRPRELTPYGTRYISMDGGRIVRDSPVPPEELPVEGNLKLRSRPARDKAVALMDEDSLVASLEDCTYIYPNGQTGCRNVSLQVHRGEVLALMGLNGSGKSTVAKHFNALVRPTSGTVRFMGRDTRKADLGTLRRNVGFLFQNPDLQIFAGTVEEEVAFGLKVQKLPAVQIRERVEQVLQDTGLISLRAVHPHRLSRGQRLLLALASILAVEPELVVADEPTAGLDQWQAAWIMKVLSRVAASGGAVLLVTHDLKLASCYAHRVVAMNSQQVRLDIPVARLDNHLEALKGYGLDFQNLQPDFRKPNLEYKIGSVG